MLLININSINVSFLKNFINNNKNLKLLIMQRQFSKQIYKKNCLFIWDPQKFFYKNLMPQLIPFYFVNQFSFSFLTLLSLIYIFSKYVLPLFTFQQVIRMYITKLSNKS